MPWLERSLENAEPLEKYRVGGMHPVRLGDKFKDGKYQIVRKLGHGSYGTVWLARDLQAILAYSLVAIKIPTAQSSQTMQERELHEVLHSSEDYITVKDYIVPLLDSFYHVGPNGTHLCLVFPPMGPDAFEIAAAHPPTSTQLPAHLMGRAIKRLLLGLHHLHRNGIVYCDIGLQNLLTTTDPLRLTSVAEILEYQPEFARVIGPRTGHVPEYICEGLPLLECVENAGSVQIKLTDLGCAFRVDRPPIRPTLRRKLRAPEVILHCGFDHRMDIWSFGCFAYELLTDSPLFPVGKGDEQEVNDTHLLQICRRLGPPAFSSRNSPIRQYFLIWLASLNFSPFERGSTAREEEIQFEQSLGAKFMRKKPEDMDEAEARVVIALLKKTLQWDPDARPTTAELLQDPWIARLEG